MPPPPPAATRRRCPRRVQYGSCRMRALRSCHALFESAASRRCHVVTLRRLPMMARQRQPARRAATQSNAGVAF
jgi:hypothetical protein